MRTANAGDVFDGKDLRLLHRCWDAGGLRDRAQPGLAKAFGRDSTAMQGVSVCNMKTSILIVTCEKHFHWLKWCLKSIAKFATGFHEVVIGVPSDTDWRKVLNFCSGYDGKVFLRFYHFDDWPGRGFLRHMDRIIYADQICLEADFILHMDSDCIFAEPVTPGDYFVDGKPVLMFGSYDWVSVRFNPWRKPASESYFLYWKKAVEACLGGVSLNEFMRRHPAVHYRETYQMTRESIEKHTGWECSEYIRSMRNEFPQSVCEFNTLGEVAWRRLHDGYHWVNQETEGRPHDKLIEFWSHGPIDKEQELTWTDAPMRKFIPIEVIQKVLA